MKNSIPSSKARQKKWLEFEQLVSAINAQACPEAEVKHNDFVTGKSGIPRQLDVTIRKSIGPYAIFVVLECKRKRRPVTIAEVEAFATKMKDVSASRGVLVAPAGFSKGSRAMAKEKGVILLSYRQATKTDWTLEASISPIFYRSDQLLAHFQTKTGEVNLSLDEQVLFGGSNETVSLRNIIEEVWHIITRNEMVGDIAIEIGLDPTFVTSRGDLITTIIVVGNVRAFAYPPIPLQFASGHVLEDAETKAPQITSVASEGIDLQSLRETGQGREITAEELHLGSECSVRSANCQPPLLSFRGHTSKRYVRVSLAITSEQK